MIQNRALCSKMEPGGYMQHRIKKIWIGTLLVGVLCLHTGYDYPKKASVKKTYGNVEKSTQELDWTNLNAGEEVSAGNTIRTGADSFCNIFIDSSNSFRIKEETTVKIARLWEPHPEKDNGIVKLVSLNLLDGEIISALDALPKDTRYEVTTPVSIAGAKGTGYSVEYNPQSGQTDVSVYEHSVLLTSVQESQKYITVQSFQKVELATWETATLSEAGTGVLSEAILGKEFVQKKLTERTITGLGKGSTAEEARASALGDLKHILLNQHINPEQSLGSYILANIDKAEQLYSLIDQLNVKVSDNFMAQASLDLATAEQALGIKFQDILGPVQAISLAEYGKKFGAKARVTTQRAATVDAYRNLAEKIYGTQIDAQTKIQDFATKNDVVKTKIQGLVQGAQPVDTSYYSDGSIIVTLRINASLIPQQLESSVGPIFGSTYIASPELIEFSDFEEFKNIL